MLKGKEALDEIDATTVKLQKLQANGVVDGYSKQCLGFKTATC